MVTKKRVRKSENTIMKEVQLALSHAGCTVFRNETAGAWVGRLVFREGTSVSLHDAQRVQAGLCVGSSDLIGWTSDGRFLAVEVKTPKGTPTKQQVKFIEAVKASGGVGGIVRSVEEAIALL